SSPKNLSLLPGRVDRQEKHTARMLTAPLSVPGPPGYRRAEEEESTMAQWAARLGKMGAGLVIVGPLLAHFWVLPPLGGVVIFDLGGLMGLVALILGIIAAVRGQGVGAGLALGATILLLFVFLASGGSKVPRINDITTDTVNPPKFVKAGELAA